MATDQHRGRAARSGLLELQSGQGNPCRSFAEFWRLMSRRQPARQA